LSIAAMMCFITDSDYSIANDDHLRTDPNFPSHLLLDDLRCY